MINGKFHACLAIILWRRPEIIVDMKAKHTMTTTPFIN